MLLCFKNRAGSLARKLCHGLSYSPRRVLLVPLKLDSAAACAPQDLSHITYPIFARDYHPAFQHWFMDWLLRVANVKPEDAAAATKARAAAAAAKAQAEAAAQPQDAATAEATAQ